MSPYRITSHQELRTMLKYHELESTKHWEPVDQQRRRQERLTEVRANSERYLWLALGAGMAVALVAAALLGAFDTLDLTGPARHLGAALSAR